MISMNLHQAAAMIGATLIGKPAIFRGISTDSRVNCDNSLFIALKGENHDAIKFASSAVENGATAVMVNEDAYNKLIKTKKQNYIEQIYLGL